MTSHFTVIYMCIVQKKLFFFSFWLMKTDEKDNLFFFTKLLKLTDGVQQFSVLLLYRSTSLSRALTASLWTDYCRGSVLFYAKALLFYFKNNDKKKFSPLLLFRYTGRFERTLTWPRIPFSAWPSWPPCTGLYSQMRTPRSLTWPTWWRGCSVWSMGEWL